MSKYLITGVQGFVGRYFVEYLLSHEPEAKIFGVDIAQTCDMPIAYHSVDLNNAIQTEQIIQSTIPDYILHLASISSVGQSWQNPALCFKNNTDIMLNILEAVRKQNLKTRILSIGSSEEYGEYASQDMPLKETYKLNPLNPYAVAKVSQEMLCKVYTVLDVDVVMTRSFNHIGPRQSDRFVVPSFIKQLVTISQGKQEVMSVGNIEVARDFTDVRDVVAAYYAILHRGKRGEVYNVCSGTSHKLSEIIKTAENILGIKADIRVDETRLRPNDAMFICGSSKKINEELGWFPKYSFEQTIKDIVTYWQQN